MADRKRPNSADSHLQIGWNAAETRKPADMVGRSLEDSGVPRRDACSSGRRSHAITSLAVAQQWIEDPEQQPPPTADRGPLTQPPTQRTGTQAVPSAPEAAVRIARPPTIAASSCVPQLQAAVTRPCEERTPYLGRLHAHHPKRSTTATLSAAPVTTSAREMRVRDSKFIGAAAG